RVAPSAAPRPPAPPAPLLGGLRPRAVDANPPLGRPHGGAQPLPASRPGPYPGWFPPRRTAPGCALDASRPPSLAEAHHRDRAGRRGRGSLGVEAGGQGRAHGDPHGLRAGLSTEILLPCAEESGWAGLL